MQKFRQTIWKRWQQEYLQELQKRKKWQTHEEQIELNTLVLPMEDNIAPLQWPLGRRPLVELHPGKDGYVRVVSVLQRNTGIYKRAVRKICPLPLAEDGEKENLVI